MQTNANYLTCAQVAQTAPGRPSANCVWRWARRGVRARTGQRVFLDHVRAGKRVFIPAGALEKFMAALAEADRGYFASREMACTGSSHPTASEQERRREIENAEADLDRSGLRGV